VRIGLPVAALAAEGSALPGQPRWNYHPFDGDANGYHAAARELIAAAGRVPAPALAAVAVLIAVSLWAALRLRTTRHRWVAPVLPAFAVSCTAVLVVREMTPSGAPVIGWSLLWAVLLAPIRATGISPSRDVAFGVGLAVSLVALAAATIATAYVGLYATGRRAVGIGAAGLFAVWPFATGTIVGERAWENGTWNVDVGLSLYTEPVSTALVTTAVALVLRPRGAEPSLAVAGLALGFSTVVKLSNGLLAAVLALLVALRGGRRAALPFAVGGLVWLPLLVAYWPKGYVDIYGGDIAATDTPWSIRYVDDAWTDSLLFTPRLLLLLAPLFLVGCLAVGNRWTLAVLLAPIVVNAAVYSVYFVTELHPRFLFAGLPFVFVLEALGAIAAVDRIAVLYARRRAPT
jgi:hypothetical protein